MKFLKRIPLVFLVYMALTQISVKDSFVVDILGQIFMAFLLLLMFAAFWFRVRLIANGAKELLKR